MSLQPHSPTEEATLQKNVITTFGVRSPTNKQAPTIAAGFCRSRQVLFVAKQGGPVDSDKAVNLWALTESATAWRDARYDVKSKLNMGEWTSYHAEMIIVSAMLEALAPNANHTVQTARTLFADNGPVYIAANAACCKHCTNMLKTLGIKYGQGSTDPGLTGWWNPFTDKAYAQASDEFQHESVPGLPENVFKTFVK